MPNRYDPDGDGNARQTDRHNKRFAELIGGSGGDAPLGDEGVDLNGYASDESTVSKCDGTEGDELSMFGERGLWQDDDTNDDDVAKGDDLDIPDIDNNDTPDDGDTLTDEEFKQLMGDLADAATDEDAAGALRTIAAFVDTTSDRPEFMTEVVTWASINAHEAAGA